MLSVVLLHWVEQPLMRITTSCIEVLLVASHLVCVGKDFVHSAMFHSKQLFKLFVADISSYVYEPVTATEEQLLGVFVAAIQPCVTQSCFYLVKVVERHPSAIEDAEVALLEVCPHGIAVRHTAYIAFAPFRVILFSCFCALLQFLNHIQHALFTLLVAL